MDNEDKNNDLIRALKLVSREGAKEVLDQEGEKWFLSYVKKYFGWEVGKPLPIILQSPQPITNVPTERKILALFDRWKRDPKTIDNFLKQAIKSNCIEAEKGDRNKPCLDFSKSQDGQYVWVNSLVKFAYTFHEIIWSYNAMIKPTKFYKFLIKYFLIKNASTGKVGLIEFKSVKQTYERMKKEMKKIKENARYYDIDEMLRDTFNENNVD